MSWVVAIPSYNRAKVLKKKSLETLLKGGVPAHKIYIFVASDKEKDVYQSELELKTYNKIIVGVLGLSNQRKFISSHFPKGQQIVSIDDDIRDIVKATSTKTLSSVKDLPAFFTEAFKKCKEVGANIWGVGAVANAFYMYPAPLISTGIVYLPGGLFGYNNTKDPKYDLDFGDATEDKERTLKYYVNDGKIVKFNHYSIKTTTFTKGGMGNDEARYKSHEIATAKVEAKYPKLVKRVHKSNGLWDLKFIRQPKTGVAGGGLPATFHGGHSAPHTYNEISEEELNNSEISRLAIRNLTNYHKTRTVLLEALNNITVPKIAQGLHNRGLVIGDVGRTLTFGFGDNRHGWNFYKSNERHDDVYKALINFGNQVVPKGWKYQGITLNYGVKAKKHIDSKNVGRSVIIGIGDYTGGDIRVWNKDDKNPKDYNIHEKPTMFNGGILPHETQPFKGERYTIIFFKQKTRPKGKEIGVGKGQTGKVAETPPNPTPAPIFA